jgi:ATP-dependent RNA helicase DDX19/DBP5
MIGQSQSGTGKTAAFALTMLSRVDMDLKAPQVRSPPPFSPSRTVNNLPHYAQAICIAPSRELAIQILNVVQRMGEYTPVECFFAGKDSVKKGMPKLTAQIVIGTPGTMIDVRSVSLSFAILHRMQRDGADRRFEWLTDGY